MSDLNIASKISAFLVKELQMFLNIRALFQKDSFPSIILNFFPVDMSFSDRFQEKSSRFHSSMPDITKRNLNAHFICSSETLVMHDVH